MLNDLRKIYREEIVSLSNDEGRSQLMTRCCTRCNAYDNSAGIESSHDADLIATGITSNEIISLLDPASYDLSTWHELPVMFLSSEPKPNHYVIAPSPSSEIVKNYSFFQSDVQRGLSNDYWQHFEYRSVQELFSATVRLFKLKQATFTYLRKCRLTKAPFAFSFGQGNKYWRNSVQTCFDNFLHRELVIMKPRIIFCIEADVRDNLLTLLSLRGMDASFEIALLPKPSYTRLLGFRQQYYKHALLGLIIEGLSKTGVISADFASELFFQMTDVKKTNVQMNTTQSEYPMA